MPLTSAAFEQYHLITLHTVEEGAVVSRVL